MRSLLVALLTTQTVLAFPPSFSFSQASSQQQPLNPAAPVLPKKPTLASEAASSIPSSDTIICPHSEAIIPVYGSPNKHHSYATAVNTFCRRDLAHVRHAAPHTSGNKPSEGKKNGGNAASYEPESVSVSPKKPLSRSYRVTLVMDKIAGEDDYTTTSMAQRPYTNGTASNRSTIRQQNRAAGNAKKHAPNNHQLELEIQNNANHPVGVTTEDCVASFMAIVDAAGGCRVSDALTKTGEYHVGSNNERGMGGVVYKATQWT